MTIVTLLNDTLYEIPTVIFSTEPVVLLGTWMSKFIPFRFKVDGVTHNVFSDPMYCPAGIIIDRSEPSIDDESRTQSLKLMVILWRWLNAEKTSYLNKAMLLLKFRINCLAYGQATSGNTIVTIHLPIVKWHKWILAFNFENNAAQWGMTGWIFNNVIIMRKSISIILHVI